MIILLSSNGRFTRFLHRKNSAKQTIKAKIKAGGTMIAVIATLTIGFFLAAITVLNVGYLPHICGQTLQEKTAKRGRPTGCIKKLKVHLKRRSNRVKTEAIPAPPREWKLQPLNKLELCHNYIIKKAEIAPIR